MSWLKRLFSRRRLYGDLSEEIRKHLEEKVEELVAGGMSRKEAAHAARREFGNVTHTEEDGRAVWRWAWLDDLFMDLRYGVRLLLKNRSFTVVAVSTLGLGIAAAAVLFSIFVGGYIHFGETEQANRVALLGQRSARGLSLLRFSAPEYFDIAGLQRYRSFDGFFAIRGLSVTLSENLARPENPERVQAVRASANIFSLYGTSPILGRTFETEEDRPGGPNVAILTHGLWKRRFGGDPAIIGMTIKLNDIPYTVIGIVPPRFKHWGAEIYIPLELDPASNNRSERNLLVAAITKKDFSVEQIKPELEYLAHREEAEYGAAHPEYAGLVYEPVDVRKAVLGDLRIALYILMGAVAMLALITSANIAGLLVARAIARAGEIGTRLVLGAMPARLARQFLTESILLSAIAGVAGFVAGVFALKPILALIPAHYIGSETDIHASPTAFLVSVSAALLIGVLFGLAPALFISRRGVSTNLQQSRTRSVTDQGGGRIRAALALLEMALAFVVVMGAGLMVRTYRQVVSMDLGFHPDHVLTMRVALPESRYSGGVEVANFFRELLRGVHSMPGVIDVSASSTRPAGEGLALHDFSIPGRTLNTADGTARAGYRIITPEYFAVVRTPLQRGRFFTEQDSGGASAVAIVNESFEQTYFPDSNAIGKQIRLENPNGTGTSTLESPPNQVSQIVGVVRDSRQIGWWQGTRELYNSIPPEIYVPFWQHPEAGREMALLLRTQADPGNLADAVRREVLALDGKQPVYDVQTLQALADNALGPTRLCLVILGVFAGVALLTACVGLYAIASYSVTQRTHEIGIRMALGAKQRDVLRLVAREGMPVIVVGLVAGLLASFGLARLMSSLLYGVPPNDGATLLVVSVILTATGMLAVYVPARRAISVDPMEALRYE